MGVITFSVHNVGSTWNVW